MKALLIITILLAIGAVAWLVYLYSHRLGVKVGDIDGGHYETWGNKKWQQSLKMAKEKVKELGFRLPPTGTMLVINNETKYFPSFSDEVIVADLDIFEPIPFGEEITLYVHSSGNLCFLMKHKGEILTGYVFEK